MSTTPMQRPFLVDQAVATRSHASREFGPRNPTGKGIHLVPASVKNKLLAAPQLDAQKIVVAAAALFLVLTI